VEEALLVDLTHRVLRDLRDHAHLVRYTGFGLVTVRLRVRVRVRLQVRVNLRDHAHHTWQLVRRKVYYYTTYYTYHTYTSYTYHAWQLVRREATAAIRAQGLQQLTLHLCRTLHLNLLIGLAARAPGGAYDDGGDALTKGFVLYADDGHLLDLKVVRVRARVRVRVRIRVRVRVRVS